MSDEFEELRRRSETLKKQAFQDFWSEIVECSEIIRQLMPNKRRPWIASVINDMYEEQNGNCALTGVPLDSDFEVDHVIPISYGGGNERGNLRLVSRAANRSRGNRGVSPQDLLRYLEDRYANR